MHFLIVSRKLTLTVGLLLICLLAQLMGVFCVRKFPVLGLFGAALPLSLILLSRKIAELLTGDHVVISRTAAALLVILVAVRLMTT